MDLIAERKGVDRAELDFYIVENAKPKMSGDPGAEAFRFCKWDEQKAGREEAARGRGGQGDGAVVGARKDEETARGTSLRGATEALALLGAALGSAGWCGSCRLLDDRVNRHKLTAAKGGASTNAHSVATRGAAAPASAAYSGPERLFAAAAC